MHSSSWTIYLSLSVWALLHIIEPATLFAQHQPLIFENYGSSTSGITNAATMDIIQDSQGFLWLGTEKGIQRYDGTESIHYSHDPLDSTSITLDFIEQLEADNEGMIWARGFNRIMRFNPRLELADNFQRGPLSELTSDNDLLKITADTKHGIWLGTKQGLSYYSISENRLLNYSTIPRESDSLDITDVHSIVSDYSGSVWFNVGDHGLARLTPESSTIDYFDHQSDSTIFPLNNISPLIASPSGIVWFGTSSGLIRYDTDREEFEVITISD